jgi:hypothetical protein
VCMTSPLWAQTQSSWNRKVEAIAMTSAPGAPAGTYDIHVVWSNALDLADSEELNLNSDLVIAINGTAVETIAQDQSFFGPISCAVGCQPECNFGRDCKKKAAGCDCMASVIVAAGPFSLSSGDQVEATIVPARGGVAEQLTDDDVRTATFDGEPIFWNRRIAAVELIPSGPVRSLTGVYDVQVDWVSATRGIDYPVDLSAAVEVSVNGIPTASVRDIRTHDPTPCSLVPPSEDCNGNCGTGDIGDITAYPLECQPDSDGEHFWCQCQALASATIPGLSLNAGDVVQVALIPPAARLPELVGLTADDTATVAVCSTCGDVDATGGPVDLNDFATLALCYGIAAPAGDCSQQGFVCSDLDGDGVVGLNDFATFAVWYGLQSTQAVPNCAQP